MAKTIEEAMAELRRDVDRWNVELRQLRAEGHRDLVERVQHWIEEAERILYHWGN